MANVTIIEQVEEKAPVQVPEESPPSDDSALPNPLFDKLGILLQQEPAPDDISGTPSTGTSAGTEVSFALRERYLVAWVLLTRLDQDDLDRAWKEHHTVLESFAIDLLRIDEDEEEEEEDKPPQQQRHEVELYLYLRLVAQVTARLTDYPGALGQAIFKAWKTTSTSSSTAHDDSSPSADTVDIDFSIDLHISNTNMDVCTSLDKFLESDPAMADELGIVEYIWKIYINTTPSLLLDTNADPGADPSTAKTTTEPHKQQEATTNKNDTKEEQEWNLMGQTLTSLLNKTHTDYSITAWHELILGLVQSHGTELWPDGLISSLLTWMAQPPPTVRPALRVAWHEWFLSLVQARLLQNNPTFRLLLLKDPKSVQQLQHLLLAHVISPDGDPALRAMAWQTVVALVETSGWNWMMTTQQQQQQQQPGNTLGKATLLCTWIRLASGEWRIQLQTPPDSALWQATALPVGHGCARLLQSVVQYCVELSSSTVDPGASSSSSCSMPLSHEALLHLRTSLEQALWTTTEYLSISTSSPEERTSLFHVALSLLGTLLMEVDIWDLLGQNNNITTTNRPQSPEPILECLQTILGDAQDPSLLPGLVHILGDAEDDAEKQGQLQALGIWEPLLEYLEWYWHCEWVDESVAWACPCTELWAAGASPAQRRRLSLAVLAWIQHVLQQQPQPQQMVVSSSDAEDTTSTSSSSQQQGANHTTTNIPKSHLSLALGCYMTLSQDRAEAPKEHESRVILRALQWCERG
jgi:hypothetical protein